MLDCLNNFLHGFVAVPTILACRERGFFTCLEQQGPKTAQGIANTLGANEGHLRAALRMMLAMGWLLKDKNRAYRLTPKAGLAQEIPSDIMNWFREWRLMDLTDPAGRGPALSPWIDRSLARWQVSDPLLADFLDGILVIPLFLLIHKGRLFNDRVLVLNSLAVNRRDELSKLFIGREWAEPNPDGNPDEPFLTDSGRFLVQRALLSGVTASYTPMLSQMPELLFGDPRTVFAAGESFQEQHLDRDMNVAASGFQHSKYFEDADEILCRIFNQPIADQPDCVVDMGCGDGALLSRIHKIIQTRTSRGRQLAEHPIQMIGVDYNLQALKAAEQTLAGIPHILFQGDVGDPERLANDLRAHSVDLEKVLHIRSFLDHERPFLPPRNPQNCQDRKGVSGQGVFVDLEGCPIPAHVMIQSLVEHLDRWAQIVNRHGLIILEVHSLPAAIVADHLSLIENLHFDACHAFSMQHLTEADVFLAAAAETGLFPKNGCSRNYPNTLPFSRITLHCFEKRAYKVRLMNQADLPALRDLHQVKETQFIASLLQDRIEHYPQGQFVAESDGRIIGAAYSCRASDASSFSKTAFLHTDNGKIVFLLGVDALPDALNGELEGQLLDFMLQYSRLIPGVEDVIDMTGCMRKEKAAGPLSLPESFDLPCIIKETLCQVMGPERAADYSSERPLMMMGLDSLELMELRNLLNRRLGVSLKPTFFFQYQTPEAIVGYFQDQEKGPRIKVETQCIASLQEGAGGRDFPKEKCLHHLFEAQVRRTPEAIAVQHEGKTLSYGALDRRANQLAHRLQNLGVGPDTVVGLCLERSLELIIGLIGILKAGGAYMPLDPAYPGERLSFMLENSKASLILTQRSMTDRLPSSNAQILCLDDENSSLEGDCGVPLSPVTPHNLLYVIHTSGSTGQPKGIAMPHAPLVNLVWWQVRQRTFNRGPRVLQFTPISFDVSCQEMFSAWASGGTLVVVDETTRRDPPALLRFMDEQAVECLFLPFVALQRLAEAAESAPVPSALREVITAGEQLQIQPALVRFFQRLPRCRLYNQYGPAETHVVTQYPLKGPPETWPALPPVGRPLPNCLTYILDENGRQVPEGKTGELWLGGVNIARGYLHQPELTAERFQENPFTGDGRIYKTGDMARYLPDGNIEFLGRSDHQVKIRGIRVELGEIEVVLAQHPAVKEAAVVAKPDGVGQDKRLVAYVAGRTSPPALTRYLAEKLPEIMVPSRIMVLPALPLTPSGKIDRRSLPEPSAERPPISARYVPPESPTEHRLAKLWGDILRLDRVGIHDPFFDLGGNSLLMAHTQTRLAQIFPDRPVRIFDLFQYSTIASLARYLDERHEPGPVLMPVDLPGPSPRQKAEEPLDAIAIIGLACRFPGASDPDTFWENLCLCRESISFFSPDELEIDPPPWMDGSYYVRARAILSDIKGFDARFFGYSDREAELLDPQHRIFLECAYEAFENAGYAPETIAGPVGVYAGVGMNTYLINNVNTGERAFSGRTFIESATDMQALISSDKDFLPTHTAYRLNLRGPAVAVQAACSTGLVAVHQACRSIIAGECNMALAGAASISVPQKVGYFYQPDMMFSPDGHCRAFDAEARGTVFGNGVGVVLLKRLDAAMADDDYIYAVIQGSAVNNDGAAKVGFTAPGAEAQAAVIARAQASAGINARDISYVEAHGTGTTLGDPVEIAALTRAFQQHTKDRGFCAIGSVKTNVGHLATAAGIAGLIKTALAIHKGKIPPSLHFTRPNPRIDFENSPFFVNTSLKTWEGRCMAGVSAFGMGGTNAHLVLAQAPERAEQPVGPDRPYIFTLSARSKAALTELNRRYADWLENETDAGQTQGSPLLADICFTSTRGRNHFEYRRALVVRSKDQLIRRLRHKVGKDDSPDGDDQEKMLTSLGERYVRGESIDWTEVCEDFKGRRIPMPTYPFQRRPYWISPAKRKAVLPKTDQRADDDANVIDSAPLERGFCKIQWQPLEWLMRTGQTQGRAQGLPLQVGPNVIFSDSGGVGQSLARNLTEQGADCVQVFPGEAYQRIDSRTYQAHPSRKTDFKRLFQDVANIQGIVYLWSLEVRNDESLYQTLPVCCSGPLYIIQALGSAFLHPRLWLITRESQAVLPDDRVSGAAQAALFGLGRVIMLEHPEFDCVCLDIGSDTSSEEIAELIGVRTSLTQGSPLEEENVLENQIALRRQTAYAARLEPLSAPVMEKASGAIGIRPDACYLITGGLGGLGGLVARWLVENGARFMVLNSRKMPENSRIQDLIKYLEHKGAWVRIEPADISQPQAVEGLIAACSKPVPLAGIIHGAGVLDDGMLMRQTEERFGRVFDPKGLGAWHLHEQTLDLPLDFFVCFSSASSVLGNAGQGNYAAANAFVDALMHHRRACGLPGLSISWGPWTTGGMAAELQSRHHQRLTDMGYIPIQPQEGISALAAALNLPDAHLAFIPMNWEQYGAHLMMPLLTLMTKSAVPKRPFQEILREAPSASRRKRLVEHVRNIAAQVLGPSGEDSRRIGDREGFFDMGMDSLGAIEMRNALQNSLGCSLPPTAAFDFPTVEALTDYLLAELFPENRSPEPVAEFPDSEKIEDLSEEEAEAMLMNELNRYN